uniref:K Homology domain-containing protein n=1 Tax=Parascaris univalens TaxID=6257 RepID=A0A914ZEI8_PARUN
GINDGWEDDNDKPHIFLECEDAINRVFLRLSVCVTYVTKLLLPAHVWVDSVKNDQLAQLLSPINTTVFSQSSLENGANMAAAGVIGIMHTQHELQPMCAKNKAEIDVDAISGQWCNFWYYVWMKKMLDMSTALMCEESAHGSDGVSHMGSSVMANSEEAVVTNVHANGFMSGAFEAQGTLCQQYQLRLNVSQNKQMSQ